VVGLDWLSLAVVSGVWWRSGGRWRRLEASMQRVGALVTPASEGEGKVRSGLDPSAMWGRIGVVVVVLASGWG
jgi:hypothetical protein